MKLSHFLTVGVLAATLSLSTNVFADKVGDSMHRSSPQGEHGKHNPMMRMLRSLDLTTEQQRQIKQLFTDFKATHKGERPDMESHAEFKQILAAEQFDEAQARLLLQQRQQDNLERQVAGLKLRHDVLQVLTAEQREQLAEKQQKWHERAKKHQPE